MCDLKNEFKLCTCDFESSKSKYTWKLFRKHTDKILVVEGEFFLPWLDWKNITLPEKIEYYLNKSQDEERLFDKEITLYENDRLVLYNENELWLQFNYTMCIWEFKKSKKEPKYEVINQGYVKTSNQKIRP